MQQEDWAANSESNRIDEREMSIIEVYRGRDNSEYSCEPEEPRVSTSATIGRPPMSIFHEKGFQKSLLQFVVLCIISMIPVCIAALALSFSTPSVAVLAGIYSITGVMSLGALVGCAVRFRKETISIIRKRRARYTYLEASDIAHVPVMRISTAPDAFSNSQRVYLYRNSFRSPTLVHRPTLVPDIPASHNFHQPEEGNGQRNTILSSNQASSYYESAVPLPEIIPMPPIQVPEIAHLNTTWERDKVPLYLEPLSSKLAIGGGQHENRFTQCNLHASTCGINSFVEKYSASESCMEGLRRSIDAESILEDDESGRLLEFGKVDMKSLSPLSRSMPSASIPTNKRCQSKCHFSHYHSHVYEATDRETFINGLNKQQPKGVQQEKPVLISAEDLVRNGSSTSAERPCIQAQPSSTICNDGVDRGSCIWGICDISHDNSIQYWLKVSREERRRLVSNGVDCGVSAIPIALDTSDSSILEHFAVPVHRILRPDPSESLPTKSIYGEASAIGSETDSSEAYQEHIFPGFTDPRNTFPSSRKEQAIPTRVSSSVKARYTKYGVLSSGVYIDTMLARLNQASTLHSYEKSEQTSECSKIRNSDLEDLDTPVLDSSGLCLRRATLLSYQRKKESKRRNRKASEDDSIISTSSQSIISDTCDSHPDAEVMSLDKVQVEESNKEPDSHKEELDRVILESSISKYFSAVSLPKHRHITKDIMEGTLETSAGDDSTDSGITTDKDVAGESKKLNSSHRRHSNRTSLGINLDNLAAKLSQRLSRPTRDRGKVCLNNAAKHTELKYTDTWASTAQVRPHYPDSATCGIARGVPVLYIEHERDVPIVGNCNTAADMECPNLTYTSARTSMTLDEDEVPVIVQIT